MWSASLTCAGHPLPACWLGTVHSDDPHAAAHKAEWELLVCALGNRQACDELCKVEAQGVTLRPVQRLTRVVITDTIPYGGPHAVLCDGALCHAEFPSAPPQPSTPWPETSSSSTCA